MQVKWHSDSEPWKGFEYVFLSEEDHSASLADAGSVQGLPFRAEHMQEACPPHWRITDIIGSPPTLFFSPRVLVFLEMQCTKTHSVDKIG